MAGSMCPSCGRYTFFQTPKGRKCTKCNYEMIVPANRGAGGKGSHCYNCGKFQVFNGKCRSCGAKYIDNN